ncbi:DNA polymerase III subunit chi [Halothiobacillus sp.]|uniref:DNA polymerase III subunit chi n=1 Tax=Halothiobacillus sp. TaxID=1891311 RepID=UPI003D0E2FAD
MSAVIFHLIDDPDTEAFWFYAAELCAEAAEAGHMTYVVCANLAHVESFDDYLWGYKPDAFVPHTADPEDIAHAPIFLGVDVAAGGFDYVINLSGKPIERVAERVQLDELVDANPANRDAARARWRAYQASGAKPVHRQIAQVPRDDR